MNQSQVQARADWFVRRARSCMTTCLVGQEKELTKAEKGNSEKSKAARDQLQKGIEYRKTGLICRDVYDHNMANGWDNQAAAQEIAAGQNGFQAPTHLYGAAATDFFNASAMMAKAAGYVGTIMAGMAGPYMSGAEAHALAGERKLEIMDRDDANPPARPGGSQVPASPLAPIPPRRQSQPSSSSAAAAGPSARHPESAPADRSVHNYHSALSQLVAIKDNLSDPDQVDHLLTFHRRHDRAPTNKTIIPPFSRMSPDAEMGTALKRKASFLLISEVLSDLDSSIQADVVQTYHSVLSDEARLTLTAQVHALQKQVIANKRDFMDKVRNNQRICPLTMQTDKFKDFMRCEDETLRELVTLCGQSGPRRHMAIGDNLSEFAQRYLRVTGREPASLPDNQSVTFGNVTFTDCSVGVFVNDGTHDAISPGTIYDDRCGQKFAAIFINADELVHPGADPATTSDSDRYATAGFEDCSIAHKQAIAFLVGLFYELGDLENRIAVERGKTSCDPAESVIAHVTEKDINFKGIQQFGDRFDENGVLPDDQRIPLTSGAARLHSLALAYQGAHGTPLLADAELDKWVCSPNFAFDMETLHNPESRTWMATVDFAKQALSESEVFARR